MPIFTIEPDSYGAVRMNRELKKLLRQANGGLNRYSLVRMRKDVKGGWTRWRKGEIVKAKGSRLKAKGGKKTYLIEKMKPVVPFLPLLSQCVGVPEVALDFKKVPRRT